MFSLLSLWNWDVKHHSEYILMTKSTGFNDAVGKSYSANNIMTNQYSTMNLQGMTLMTPSQTSTSPLILLAERALHQDNSESRKHFYQLDIVKEIQHILYMFLLMSCFLCCSHCFTRKRFYVKAKLIPKSVICWWFVMAYITPLQKTNDN